MNNTDLQQHSLAAGTFGFSAANIEDLGATEYTLVTIVVDESGSVDAFKKEMQNSIKQIVESCKFSPRSSYLLLRLVAFSDDLREIHGFKELGDCELTDYNNCLQPGGCTSLFKTSKNAIDATASYGEQLVDDDYDVNAVVFIITDGDDNASDRITSKSVKNSLTKIVRDEKIESILSVLIGVGMSSYQEIQKYLENFKDDAGLSQFVPIENANAKSLAKLADFVSKSISSQSNALGSGGCSQPLTF